ncbi:MAG: hypothetical protein PWQ72_1516 [Pseudothermotoga sp.]|nr:hypothetical protein [Pseudothermotoga sp.]
MAILKPFKAVRPRKDIAFLVSCPPYDVLSVEDVKKMTTGNPYSFLHVTRPDALFEGLNDNEELYRIAKKTFDKMLENRVLFQEGAEKLYIYRQIKGDHVQSGIVGCFAVDEYQNGKIKKHELTRKEKEDDRTLHTLILNANTGLVFLAYHAEENLKDIISKICTNQPEYDFIAEDGVRNQVFVVPNEDAKKIVELFKDIDSLYITDGHHRAAAASRVRDIKREQNPNHTGKEEYNYFLAVAFPHDELKILPYNRIVKNTGMSKEIFLEKLQEDFEIEKVEKGFVPDRKHVFGVYTSGEWYKFFPKFIVDEEEPIESLDVQILQKKVMEKIFGIEDPRRDERIDFIGGVKGTEELERLVNSKEAEYAFVLYPTSIEELMRIADSNLIMPPKSTWFEPKLRSGLFVHLLD